MVPYQQNKRFIGGSEVLSGMRNMLFDDNDSKQYTHRIALYGLGGIGKTQTALEYVYNSQAEYDRIYWISAADPASLLSGYQEIAYRIGITKTVDSKPIDFIHQLMQWFRETTDRWLLIIDNLDDLDVLHPKSFLSETEIKRLSLCQMLLPENGSHCRAVLLLPGTL